MFSFLSKISMPSDLIGWIKAVGAVIVVLLEIWNVFRDFGQDDEVLKYKTQVSKLKSEIVYKKELTERMNQVDKNFEAIKEGRDATPVGSDYVYGIDD